MAMEIGLGDQAKQRTMNHDLFIGGVDGLDEAIDQIAQGKLTASIGGHLMEAAWALILIHDYHRGIDFSGSIGVQSMSSLTAINHHNYSRIAPKMRIAELKKIDFRQFSRFYNKNLTKPVVSLKALFSP